MYNGGINVDALEDFSREYRVIETINFIDLPIKAHEAGFDAMMTGYNMIFILINLFKNLLFKRKRTHIYRILFTNMQIQDSVFWIDNLLGFGCLI